MPILGRFRLVPSEDCQTLERGYSSEIRVAGAYMPVWQIPLDDTRYLNTLNRLLGNWLEASRLLFKDEGASSS
jgi:hypothetical protein